MKENNLVMTPCIIKILKQMCKEIRVAYSKVDFTKEQWYLQHTWTQYKQDKFVDWLFEYLYSNSEARKEVAKLKNTRNKEYLRKVAEHFVYNYGWKLKEKVLV